ncbi:MAG: immunoglobulin domain-containing protein, partial [Verrucomicrobiota bacterium]
MDAKRFSLIGFLVILLATRAFSQTPVWTQSANYPGSTSRNDDIHFLDETNGWAAAGGTGQIFKTTDGGKTWVLKFTKTGAHFRSIGFVSAQRGFAGNLGVGSYDTTVTDTNVLYQTSDGGETWSVFPGLSETGMKGFCAFHVMDAQHIYGGGRVRGPAYFVKSEDAGTNWTVVNLTAQGVMNGIMDVYFKDATNGFVVGMDTNSFASGFYNGCIAKTTDGGATWSSILVTTNIATCYFWKMSWPTPDIGYVTLQKNPIWNGTVLFYKTVDGGTTWTLNSIALGSIGLTSFYTQGIGFVNASEGWMGGDGNTAPLANNFLHTIDGGATWQPAGYNDSRRINRIRFLNPNFGYAAGLKLHIFRPRLAITSQPQSVTNSTGSSASFNVTAQGTPPLAYQWRFNGVNISGANSNSFSITNIQTGDFGNYDTVVGDTSGSLTSVVVVLNIADAVTAPSITSQPQTQSVSSGSTVNFSVAASGSLPISYQWQFNATNISGATTTNYILANVQLTNSGGYSVIVTNSGGS